MYTSTASSQAPLNTLLPSVSPHPVLSVPPVVMFGGLPQFPPNPLTFCCLFADWILSVCLQTSNHKPILVALCYGEEGLSPTWGGMTSMSTAALRALVTICLWDISVGLRLGLGLVCGAYGSGNRGGLEA